MTTGLLAQKGEYIFTAGNYVVLKTKHLYLCEPKVNHTED